MLPLQIPGALELLVLLLVALLFLAVPAVILLAVLRSRGTADDRVAELEERVDELERELEREVEREHAADERDEPPVGEDPPVGGGNR